MTAQPHWSDPAPARRVFGTAGGSLTNASFLGAGDQGAARVGQAGEVRTAALLDQFAVLDNGVTVFHDLKMPWKKFKANIDHVVVSGNTVYPIDSKVWKPGFYWTVGGKTRRGWARFEPADKQTMVVIEKSLVSHFEQLGIKANVAEPLLLVWPSSKYDKLRTGFLTVPGARVIPGPQVEKVANSLFKPSGFFSGGKGRPADSAIVRALMPLLNGSKGSGPVLTDDFDW